MRTVLVSGAGRGLGLAISRRLIRDGYRVLGIGRNETAEFAGLAMCGAAVFQPYDLSDLAGIHDLVTGLTRVHGPIYGLVNNAAVGLDGVLATMHASDITMTLTVNLAASIHLAKYASRSMLVQREGRIVNVSSIIARTGFNGLSVYAASKAGLEGFTRSLARELGRANITVNCIAPGFMDTGMTSKLEDSKLEAIRRRSPLGLAGTDDAAGAVAYLLGPDAARVTGTTLTVDGGSTA
jgi:3-oxoacyl-[acyl-carrier protein] reductase